MGKRRLPREQLAFDFATPAAPAGRGDLAGLSRWIAESCGKALHEDSRDRETIARRMSELLGEDVTKFMLDAWSSPARREHNIGAARWLALIAVTGRYDILDAGITRIGARALQGEEMATARLGHLYAVRAEIDEQIKAVRPMARPFRRGRE